MCGGVRGGDKSQQESLSPFLALQGLRKATAVCETREKQGFKLGFEAEVFLLQNPKDGEGSQAWMEYSSKKESGEDEDAEKWL